MKALSIQQPWAEFIAAGLKPSENRTSAFRYRGPMLIHASKQFDGSWKARIPTAVFHEATSHISRKVIGARGSDIWHMGCVIAIGILYDVTDYCFSDWCEPGALHLHFIEIHRLPKPIPAIGKLSIFNVPRGLLTEKDIRLWHSVRMLWRRRYWKTCPSLQPEDREAFENCGEDPRDDDEQQEDA